MTKRQQRNLANIWNAIRAMIAPELARFRTRYPHGRRVAILEAMHAAAVAEDATALCQAGDRYLRLTRRAPPGCYVVVSPSGGFFLDGDRVLGRGRGSNCEVRPFSPQVWR